MPPACLGRDGARSQPLLAAGAGPAATAAHPPQPSYARPATVNPAPCHLGGSPSGTGSWRSAPHARRRLLRVRANAMDDTPPTVTGDWREFRAKLIMQNSTFGMEERTWAVAKLPPPHQNNPFGQWP